MSITQKIKSITATILLVVMMFVAFAPVTQAQTINYPSQNINTLDEFIDYLYALIDQLEQLKAAQVYQNQHQYRTNYNYQPYRPVQNSNYNVNVDTVSVGNTDDDETTLYGDIDLNGAPYAYVWFEYGQDGDLDENTRKMKMDYTQADKFGVRITNLDEDERYVFRAVSEDPNGRRDYGEKKYFQLDGYSSGSNRSDDEPDVETEDAEEVEDNEAELHGEVDMNDFNNGYVFFVYGEDEDQVEDAEDEDEYRDIDEDEEDLQKVVVDTDLDGDRNYWRRVVGLDDDTDHYFRICVEFEDDDDDETLECGDVEHFETD